MWSHGWERTGSNKIKEEIQENQSGNESNNYHDRKMPTLASSRGSGIIIVLAEAEGTDVVLVSR